MPGDFPSFVKNQSPTGTAFNLDGFKSVLEELQESKRKQKKGFVTGSSLIDSQQEQ
jgi:hypothetical protein